MKNSNNTMIKMRNASKKYLMLTVVLMAAILMPQGLKAQEISDGYFTLTNGTQHWFEGPQGSATESLNKYDTSQRNESNEWVKIYETTKTPKTQKLDAGTVYCAIDTATTSDHVTMANIRPIAVSDFSPFCVWKRTGFTGYYYQEHTDNTTHRTYRYYLIGSSTEGLYINKVELGSPLENSTYWYNWDHGAAVTESQDGVRARYYWLMYDDVDENTSGETPRWRMSRHSYQRPEDIAFNGLPYDEDHLHYFDEVELSNGVRVPNGNGALYMPVYITHYPKANSEMPAGCGLNDSETGLVAYDGGPDYEGSMKYGDEFEIKFNDINIPAAGVQVSVKRGYVEYKEELKRYYMNFNYKQRPSDGFNTYGIVPADGGSRNFYYYDDDPLRTRYTAPLEGAEAYAEETLKIKDTVYSLDPRSRRYLEIIKRTDSDGDFATIHCMAVPPTMVSTLKIIVNYTNGTADTTSLVIPLRHDIEPSPDKTPVNAPVIYGYVVCGGRMAGVGDVDETGTSVDGNTSITVHNADTIYAIYGGNDIAGWVQGKAKIQIGTKHTAHTLPIGYIYGGGCGFYTYQGINQGHDPETNSWFDPYVQSGKLSLMYQAYYFNGKVYAWNSLPSDYEENAGTPAATAGASWEADSLVVDHVFSYTPKVGTPESVDQSEDGMGGDGTIPYIKSAYVTVGVSEEDDPINYRTYNDFIKIDSLFGGAENSFIGVTSNEHETPHQAVNIDVHGGTIYSVFGGNNYGGSVANTSTVIVDVYDTKLTDKEGINNTMFTGYGHDFGIRYLYGGGNLVDGSHALVRVHGGMVDTMYLGGNNATVNRPIGVVDCRRTGVQDGYGNDGHFIFENSYFHTPINYGDDFNPATDRIKYTGNNFAFTAGNANIRSEFRGDQEYIDKWIDTTVDLAKDSIYVTYYNAAAPDTADNCIGIDPGHWNAEIGRYNVRVLFGGNNQAAMKTLSTINLFSGGVSYVYGGGNAGDMDNDITMIQMDSINPRLHMVDSMIRGLDGWPYGLPHRIGAIVHSVPGAKIIVENVYGGCRMANVKNSSLVWLSGGAYGYVHGGCDISGDVGSEAENDEGTWVVLDHNSVVMQDVYGGSDGYYHCHENGRYVVKGDGLETEVISYNGDPYDPYNDYVGYLVPTHNHTNLYINGGTVLYAAYGGGVMTNVGSKEGGDYIKDNGVERLLDCDAKSGTVHFVMNGGTIGSTKFPGTGYGAGNAYGGGYLSSIYGLSRTLIKGDSKILGSLYAGNDCVGSIENFMTYKQEADNFYVFHSDVYDSNYNRPVAAIAENAYFASDGTTLMNTQDDQGKWNSKYSSYLKIVDTPTIGNVYGSGNGAYDYDGTHPEYSSLEPVCLDGSNVDNNRPYQSSTFVDVNTSGGIIDNVFGGGNGVGVREERGAVVMLNCTSPSVNTVGNIFGGNNVFDMATCVPELMLKRGTVRENVYGGGNAGNMNGKTKVLSVCGDTLLVSTYVLIESDEINIQGDVYGGCNMADVDQMAYVDIRNTQMGAGKGLNNVYGGNNISGKVWGNTRVDISGGQVKAIYGGSNGKYDYYEVADGKYNIYPYDSIFPYTADTTGQLIASFASMPDVSTTNVNVYGGIIGDLYGGGRMGNCGVTNVLVDDHVGCTGTGDAEITGNLFGGGEGEWKDLNKPRRGNVTDSTNVVLKHAKNLEGAKAYGGGRGGNVYTTYLTVTSDWDKPFQEIYGGCWGSDVFGTAHLTMDGSNLDGAQNAHTVFGGNDFTGNVYKSVLTINSGKYGAIFGSGNGDYDDTCYTTNQRDGAVYSGDKRLFVPNNEYVVVHFNGGHVDSNLYGGGRFGTTMAYRKDDFGDYIFDPALEAQGIIRRVPDTTLDVAHAYKNPKDYSYIIVNVHGGTFDRNIFAGAAGKSDQLVYGFKMLNMDGGKVTESIYGGSESVHDGYPNECTGTGAGESTERPSSVINIAGGMVRSSVYGGGYKGNTYGSAYINVGSDAIENCVLWDKTIKDSVGAYALFKPGATDGYVAALEKDTLILSHSIYGGANWGTNEGKFDFRVKGFYGGESRILVDGNGYNTANSVTKPEMHIANSIIGSGTSVTGGDILNRIDVLNYGEVDPTTCEPTKELRSIQRADELWLHNTAIKYMGASDAVSAYPSQNLTINRVDQVNVWGYNVLGIASLMTEIKELNFYEDALDGEGNFVLTTAADLHIPYSTTPCDPATTYCTKLAEAESRKVGAVVIYDGVNIEISTTDDGYGSVNGWGYFVAEDGTNAVITADAKYEGHTAGGGFMSSCHSDNRIPTISGEDVTWVTASSDNNAAEFEYHNYGTQYRVWSLGEGKRTRYAVILAHSNPHMLNEYVNQGERDYDDTVRFNKTIRVMGQDGKYYNLSLAHAQLKLPPTDKNHYYKLASAVDIDDNNKSMQLVDTTWNPDHWNTLSNTDADSIKNNNWADVETAGGWYALPHVENSSGFMGGNDIIASPSSTFGFMLVSGNNFKNGDSDPKPDFEADYNNAAGGQSAFAGNVHVTEDKFVSNFVSDNPNASPIIDLFLTYSNEFSNTMLGTVKFSLQEMDGTDPSNPVMVNDPIEVTVTIATILEEIRSMEHTLLAMYNEGRTNTFTRKAVLPATLQHRYVYLDGIEWFPANCAAQKFKFTGDHSNVLGTDNVFSISIEPADEVTEEVTSTIGWHSIDIPKSDIYAMAKNPASGIDRYSFVSEDLCESHEPIILDGKGRKIGELDGRGLAALKVELFFDGNVVYDNIECVGKVKLYMKTYTSQEATAEPVDNFTITLNVKTRDKADTIYVAPSASYTYTKCDGTTGTYTAKSPGEATSDIEIGKRPSKYMCTFSDAFHPKVYQEGDVIAIMETMPVENKLIIKGTDYANVEIIRYTGTHDDAPGEANVNRDALIEVKNTPSSEGYLITRNVTFNGSAVSKIKLCDNAVNSVYKQYYNPSNYKKYGITAVPNDSIELKRVDTTASYGPIVSVTGEGAKVLFEMGTYVENNYNALASSSDPTKLGAVSVTDGALLMLEDINVFRNNITVDFRADEDDPPVNGALYVRDASVKLMPSMKTAVKTITDNYLMPAAKNKVFWKDFNADVNGTDKRLRYVVDSINIDNRANVYLTRTADGSDMKDALTDIFDITSCGLLSAGTKIGVTKWFPGPTTRDTIQIAYQARGSSLSNLNNNKNNFISDEGYKVIYEYDIDNRIIYMYRCASFRHQMEGETLPLASSIETGNPLDYLPDPYTACPGGTDRMVYHVQGGFLPYTYEWYSRDEDDNLTLLRSRETEYGNLEVDEELNDATDPSTEKYRLSVTDTLRLPPIEMSYNQNALTAKYRVTASDQFGYCRVSKDIDIAISRDFDGTNAFTPGAGWTDTTRGSSAVGTRTYKAIQVTPKVWVDRSYGVVKARIPGQDTIYSTDVPASPLYPRLEDLYFCEGDVVTLHARERLTDDGHPKGQFIMWDFDPYYNPDVRYVVPAESREVIAYYGPNEYWKDHIDAASKAGVVYDDNYTYDFANRPAVSGYASPNGPSGLAGYVVTYNGDVHIYDENGLAWFISQVNGYNQQQARTFRYNKVYLHQKDGGYDMKDYLWTPVGTLQHPFRGQFMGVAANDTARLSDDTVMIKNIIINEPNVNYTGFFGFLDTARVFNIGLQGVLSRGSQYVGALAAKSNMSVIDKCAVRDSSSADNGPLTTILVTHYVSGGMIGLSDNDAITNSTVYAKFVGDAVYSGGVLGYGTSSTFSNNKGRNISRMNGIYLGGLAGYLDGTAPHNGLFRRKSTGNPSRVYNNYLHLVTDGGSQRVGGLVGQARNSIIENNYVYGNIEGTMIAAGVGAEVGDGMVADNNYYVDGSAKYAIGQSEGSAVVGDVATFQGAGNAVTLNHNVSGVNNLTRVLNIWVREHNVDGVQTYNTWRSDLDGVNDGYPLFGEPDMIPVVDSRTLEDCEQVEWDGSFYTTDTTISFNYIDSVLMVDSTLNLSIVVHHGTQTNLADSATVEEGYEGYGFSVSPAEAALLRATIDSLGYATLVLSDTLSGEWGCDSVVTITLTFTAKQGIVDIQPKSEIKVYPNPTLSFVNVEATGMSRLELYDNEGRRLANFTANGDHITIDVAPYPTGIYYIRIHTPSGITIQKVIKK